MGKKILVAGGNGLVGRNLTNKLAEIGLPFISTKHTGSKIEGNDKSIPYEFCKFEDCLAATKGVGAAVLCAVIQYGAKKSKDVPTASILPNLKIFAGLLEASARNNVGTVIMLSSSSVYQPADYPIKEDELDLNQPPYQGYFGVGWMHRYLEQLAELYSRTYGMKISILRLTNVYGPYDKFDEERAHVVPSLIRRALNKEDPFEVWGSPDVVRDFIFVDDLVGDILSILKGDVDVHNLPINICSSEPMTIKEAAQIILEVCNYKTEIYFNPKKPSAIPYRTVDNSRYLQSFGCRKRTPFRVGIEKTVEWYKKNQDRKKEVRKGYRRYGRQRRKKQ